MAIVFKNLITQQQKSYPLKVPEKNSKESRKDSQMFVC